MAFVSTLGASDANSYLSAEEAISLLEDLPQSDGVQGWLSFPVEIQRQSLVGATMAVNHFKWKGRPSYPDQSLAWPRVAYVDCRYTPMDELPIDFKNAIAYLAAFLGENGGYTGISNDDGGAEMRDNREYEEVELGNGELRVKFDKSRVMQTGAIFIPPFCSDLISKYIIDSSFTQPRLVGGSPARIRSSAAPYYGVSNVGGRRLRLFNSQIYFTNH